MTSAKSSRRWSRCSARRSSETSKASHWISRAARKSSNVSMRRTSIPAETGGGASTSASVFTSPTPLLGGTSPWERSCSLRSDGREEGPIHQVHGLPAGTSPRTCSRTAPTSSVADLHP